MAERTVAGSRVTGSPEASPGKPMANGGKISQRTPVVDKAPYAEPSNAAALRKAARSGR